MLRGCGTALVTPFRESREVDEPALRSLVDWQIGQGVDFLVPAGSTGEAATLAADEHERVVAITVDQVGGRVPVVGGAGSNNTVEAIDLSLRIASTGVTHLLHVSPPYNRPQQRGLIEHFSAVADAAPCPVVLYNVPGRTGSNITAATTLALAEHPNIVGIKEAGGNCDQVAEIARHRPAGFALLSGDDSLTVPFMALGADGVISVVANATPRAMAELVRAMERGDLPRARALHHRLADWMRVAFVESNPVPVKAALWMMGRAHPHVRLPLAPLAESNRRAVAAAVRVAGGRLPAGRAAGQDEGDRAGGAPAPAETSRDP